MENKDLLLYINPEFTKRNVLGINKLYTIFNVRHNYVLRLINTDFLQNHVPQSDSTEKLVVVGGDGTLHRVINNIPDDYIDKYAFGIIPAGTANEFSKLFSIPNNIELAAERIISSKNIKKQKIGIVNNKVKFVTDFLYGVEAEVLKSTPKFLKHAYGPNAFYAGNIIYFFKLLRFNCDLIKQFKIDSKKFRTNYLLINNVSLKTKDIELAYLKEDISESFCILYVHSRLKLIDIMRVILKKHFHKMFLDDKSIQLLRQTQIYLEFSDTINTLIDGESYAFTSPVNIRHYEKSINIIVP